MPSPDRPLSARDVILEIVHNMREGIEPLLYSSVAPGVYTILLHQDDYERLHPIASRVVDEARRALDEEVRRMNAGDRLTPGLLKRLFGRPPAIEPPTDGWVVAMQPDPDGDLQPGHIAVMSELSLPPRPQFDGTETKRITTIRRGEDVQTSRLTVATAPASATVRTPYATLSYADDDGPHSFAIEKDRVVVGRGGSGYWVDVRIQAPADVSREHLRIRRDAVSGTFYVKDLSTFGTTIDGVEVPRSVEVIEGEKRDRDIEVPLPDRARLVLAGLVTVDFARTGTRT